MQQHFAHNVLVWINHIFTFDLCLRETAHNFFCGIAKDDKHSEAVTVKEPINHKISAAKLV